MAEKKLYQPSFSGGIPQDINGNELFSFEVFKSREVAQRAFPSSIIEEYNEGDIEEPTFMDDCYTPNTDIEPHNG